MELELADTPVSAALEQSVAMVGERASSMVSRSRSGSIPTLRMSSRIRCG